ncbi:MAG: hypothetical protein JSU87_08235 [Gemmatimonadota bacterium]|nr:MAG: hypothetical protein JSU87_08235 [Gemmatimonadota bacterium]
MNWKVTYTEDTHLIGEVSRVRWNLVKQNSSAHIMTRKSDGRDYWHGKSIEHYETADGDKLHTLTNWWYVWDPFPNLVSLRMEVACGPSK